MRKFPGIKLAPQQWQCWILNLLSFQGTPAISYRALSLSWRRRANPPAFSFLASCLSLSLSLWKRVHAGYPAFLLIESCHCVGQEGLGVQHNLFRKNSLSLSYSWSVGHLTFLLRAPCHTFWGGTWSPKVSPQRGVSLSLSEVEGQWTDISPQRMLTLCMK